MHACTNTDPESLKKLKTSHGPSQCSPLEEMRRLTETVVPPLLRGRVEKKLGNEVPTTSLANEDEIARRFPNLFGKPLVNLVASAEQAAGGPLHIGCVLSGGQAAGGHNCIVGIFDYLQEHFPGSTLYGFTDGPKGVMTNSYIVLEKPTIDRYRNSGGFDMLCAGRDKIESEAQFQMAVRTARENKLDGLVVIGGDDSNTNACLLAERFAAEGLATRVIGLPKTIDGDLKNKHCEVSFGFDTASKLYAELVGNIMVDCQSSRKYYHFIRLMGREASHLTLEVALRTQPNLVFIGEEVRSLRLTLAQVTEQLADMACERAARGLEYGVVLIPEGLIDFIPEVGALIAELNDVLAKHEGAAAATAAETIEASLSPTSLATYQMLPESIRAQLLLDRDPHGNVQVAKIESERLLGELVGRALAERSAAGSFGGRFSVQYHYFGYEGRCPPPTAFDSNYCHALGRTAASLVGVGATGVMACLRGLTRPPHEWVASGVPLTSMLALERRKGHDKPVIRKALVELGGKPFAALVARRARWLLSASYVSPGPVQFDGPTADEVTLTLRLEQGCDVPEELVAPLTAVRLAAPPEVPSLLRAAQLRLVRGAVPHAAADGLFVATQYPRTFGAPRLEIVAGDGTAAGPDSVPLAFPAAPAAPMAIGVVFCGRQCPGAHNVALGMLQFLRDRAGPGARLLGFVGGTRGLFAGEARELGPDDVAPYVNCGGMALLGRSADVIRTAEHYAKAEAACAKHGLAGLVCIGGPVSNSDTAALAEHFVARGVRTRVIGVPATIDGDIYSNSMEASIGFDTACRVYASLVGNLATDAASARKYWYFIRMMGRSPSHITLECAVATQPNIALIGEELEARRMTLADIVGEIADAVAERAAAGKHFGVVLIPEGLIEYIPQVNAMLKEISSARRLGAASAETVTSMLTPYSAALLASLPAFIQQQVLLENQASDDKAQLSQVETERLLAELVRLELERRRAATTQAVVDTKFAPVCFYLGYQARSSMPSRFDADLGCALGHAAGALVAGGATGYMATAHCLASPTAAWRLCGVPLYSMMSADRRAGEAVAVIRPAQVGLLGPSFQRWLAVREALKLADLYCNPGPVQMFGPLAVGPAPGRLVAEHASRGASLAEVAAILAEVNGACWAGVPGDVLRTVLASMRALREHVSVLADRDALASTSASSHARMTQLTHEQWLVARDN